ncbi:hypothetical protein EVAR_37043_1 [Eumeta japonica]|uniref:Uncharacterized protein n=1 Tax=Eumeta variegata TaxID=151549 RepID=A0A4C1WF29_EUMVA|nr:hypothetical protein EVAR_37043_1 [Eumeta japonica]
MFFSYGFFGCEKVTGDLSSATADSDLNCFITRGGGRLRGRRYRARRVIASPGAHFCFLSLSMSRSGSSGYALTVPDRVKQKMTARRRHSLVQHRGRRGRRRAARALRKIRLEQSGNASESRN